MPSPITVNGKLVLLGISGNVGDRNSVASIVVPVRCETLAECFEVDPVAVASALGIGGLRCTDRPLSQHEDGGYEVRFTFEGFNSPVDWDFAQQTLASYSFEGEMNEEPIQTLPHFLGKGGLADRYGYSFQDEKFPRDIPGSAAAKAASALSQTEQNLTSASNPMFGVESWLKAGAVFTRSYAASVPSPSIYQGIGTLVDYPPGAGELNIPRFPGRVWLKLAPQVQSGDRGSGSAVRVTERYKLTGVTNGSEALIYNRAQLEGAARKAS